MGILSLMVLCSRICQIMNVIGNHWITISKTDFQPYHVNVFDSLGSGDLSNRTK